MARNQSRPPIALFSMTGSSSEADASISQHFNTNQSHRCGSSIKDPSYQLSSVSGGPCSIHNTSSSIRFSSNVSSSASEEDDAIEMLINTPSSTATKFQSLITSRRTVSNYVSAPPSTMTGERTSSLDTSQFLRAAIKRGVECAITAPNHKMTEPTTFYSIISPSKSSEKLLDIVYEVTLQRLLQQKLSGEEACRSEATRKREKWANIPAFLVATVGGMAEQVPSHINTTDAEGKFAELPLIPPSNIKQLEDYAASCASIQNLLLSLHSEGLGSKWATGPVIRTLAFRELIGCKPEDMIAGLIFIGWPKREPRMPRRRRELEGDVLRDV
ncbi:hypothetical protein ACHAWO_013847 [Cyclotella atomus]|uniref:Nitroreductase domain-containing protein n=1 Tax=Cyclotella atomus TaxID=382360 RepID=A0ABD3QQV1_9STRA